MKETLISITEDAKKRLLQEAKDAILPICIKAANKGHYDVHIEYDRRAFRIEDVEEIVEHAKKLGVSCSYCGEHSAWYYWCKE